MSYLGMLRRLAEQQRFADLLRMAQACWQETADGAALPLQALAAAALGRRAEAQAACAEAEQRKASLGEDARVDLAAAQLALSRPARAVALLREVLAASPGHGEAWRRLGECEAGEGRFDEAVRCFQRAAALAPHSLPAWIGLAEARLRCGELTLVQPAIDSAVAQIGKAEDCAPFLLGNLERLQLELWVLAGKAPAADAWLHERRALLADDDWAALVCVYAGLLAGHDRHAEAEDVLRGALEQLPGSPLLCMRWAELAKLQGRPQQASRLLGQALAHAGEGRLAVRLWLQMATVWALDSPRLAREAVRRAQALLATQAGASVPTAAEGSDDEREHRALVHEALCLSAQADLQDGELEASERAYRQVLGDDPWCVPALNGLGHLELQRGRVDDALALFERLREMHPARGQSALINARRLPDDPQELARLEAYARQPSLEGSVRGHLLLQLAAAWEKRDADKAFALATEANAVTRRALRYDAQAHRQHCARLRAAYTPALYRHRPGCGSDSTLPVFIVGMPRSGTTLVEQILAGHSQVHGAGELGVIPAVIAGLERWERRTGSGRRYPDCVDDLTPEVTAGIAANVVQELQAHAPDARYVIDKLPHNFENIGLIKFLFPHAKIISVRRDPRDIAISNFFTDYQAKHGGMGFAYDLTDIGEQLADHHLLMHHWHQLFPGQILEVQYEDVVADTEGQAQRMLQYLELGWEAQVLQFNELDRPVKTASVWQVRQPIYTTSKAKWKRYERHLAPLIRGTNAPIVSAPITDMATLPQPGWLHEAWSLLQAGQLNAAAERLQKLLHHVPGHAAARFALGVVHARVGRFDEAIALMEPALAACPWNREWREDLARACECAGRIEQAAQVRRDGEPRAAAAGEAANEALADPAVNDAHASRAAA